MSRESFKNYYLDNVLDFLWRQWSALGVAGSARQEDSWAIDPEALIVFSLEFARYEPRLFDEILDWLVTNGKWIDIQRLRSILKTKGEKIQRLASSAAAFISLLPGSYQRKWRALSLFRKADSKTQIEPLFFTKTGEPYLKSRTKSQVFTDYGFLRESFALRRMTKTTSISSSSNIRFLLRALFGIGSRSECILYLLTHEAGHPSEIAKGIGISVRGTQDALIELAESSLILTRIKGKRKIEYWLSQKKWWEFLKNQPLSDTKPSLWVNWIAVFNALSGVWNVLKEIEAPETSDYMKSSKLHEAMEVFIAGEFEKSGLDIPPAPGKDITIEEYAKAFEEFIKRILGTNK